MKAAIACFLLTSVFSVCPNDGVLSVSKVEWVPEQPSAGSASYVIVSGTSPSTDFIRVTYCEVTLRTDISSFGEGRVFPCLYGMRQTEDQFTIQTGAVWIPEEAGGAHRVEVRLKDETGEDQGCGSGEVVVLTGGGGMCSRKAGLTLEVETWIPINPVIGRAAYLVLDGENTTGAAVDMFSCAVTVFHGQVSFQPSGPVSCYVGIVENGGRFRVQTDAVWIPSDVPAGDYTSLIAAYNYNGEEVACWQGIVTLEE